MISKRFLTVLVLALVPVGGAAVILVGLDNRRLQARVTEEQRQSGQLIRLRSANQRTKALLTRVQADQAAGAQAIHAELERAQAEVDGLEKHAAEVHAHMREQNAMDTDSLSGNRDPEKGMVKLEYFRDAGQSSPGATLQTFLWAASKGAEEKLAGMIVLAEGAREKAEPLIAALTESERTASPTPEKLAAHFFARAFGSLSAAEVTNVNLSDTQHATVSLRGSAGKTQTVPMQLGASGWQVVVNAALAEQFAKAAKAISPPAGK